MLLSRPGLTVWSAKGASRVVLGMYGRRDPVERELLAAIEALSEGGDPGVEPMLNLALTAREDRILALLFPRGAHRPKAYFAEGADQMLISPGVIDMAGALVTVREADYEALDAAKIAAIYGEVTLPAERQAAWLNTLSQRWNDGR